MVTILLQQIIDILKEFFEGFVEWANTIGDKIAGIKEDTADISTSNNAIKANSDDIKDNTAAIITPVNSIKTNSDSIKTDTTTIKNTVGTMSNQLTTISTNVGSTAAFTEDTATNTLNILDKVTTIASDTTQIRADNQVLISNTNDLETYLYYMAKGIKRIGYGEGDLIEFNTDLRDSLIKNKITIPADNNAFSHIEYTLCGKNLLDTNEYEIGYLNKTVGGNIAVAYNFPRFITFHPIPADKDLIISFKSTDSTLLNLKTFFVIRTEYDKIIWTSGNIPFSYNDVTTVLIEGQPNTDIIICVGSDSTVDPIPTPIQGWIQVELGTSNTEYESFKGHHYREDLGELLTQGGELDVITGILTRTDGTTKQLTPVDITTNEGENFVFNTAIRSWYNPGPGTYTYNVHGDNNEIAYNESIANIIDREIGG